jgi:AraC family transcriptional regulator of adaptative response / DNA-3-methyladenine glycosylase II
MELDVNICAQARRSRDVRFDGRFFIGVRTTRIYCRLTCPVRTVKAENVLYFPTAAAAVEAGYRSCLRCRPELAPGTPAYAGSSTTVSRALRLISESPLEDEGVEELAARLGVGSRQLRRLFLRYLGASPSTVMKTRRLHFAKKLIDESGLPMGEVALASGFRSVRRFNDAFRQVYHRTPTQIRQLAKTIAVPMEHEYVFRLDFRPPFAWDSLLGFLSKRAIPGVESVTATCYSRTIALNGDAGHVSVSRAESGTTLEARIFFPEPRWLFLIVERLRRIFDLGAVPHEIAAHLGTDPLLSARIEAAPGLRVPGCWDGFELAVRAILGQQVSVAGASTLAGRLVRLFGRPTGAGEGLTHVFPKPNELADADIAQIGLPAKRAETIRGLAQAVADGRIVFDGRVNLKEFQSAICRISGIGDWTAQYIAMRALGDPDAFPANDLGLLQHSGFSTGAQLARRAEAWRPWRAYAAMYLWRGEVPVDASAAQQKPIPVGEVRRTGLSGQAL